MHFCEKKLLNALAYTQPQITVESFEGQSRYRKVEVSKKKKQNEAE